MTVTFVGSGRTSSGQQQAGRNILQVRELIKSRTGKKQCGPSRLLMPEQGDRHPPVMFYAPFYSFRILPAVEQGLPGIEMTRLMEIPVGYVPRIDMPGILVPVVPEKKGIRTHIGHMVRVAGNGNGILVLCLEKNFVVAQAGGDELPDIKQDNVRGLFCA